MPFRSHLRMNEYRKNWNIMYLKYVRYINIYIWIKLVEHELRFFSVIVAPSLGVLNVEFMHGKVQIIH